MSVYHAMVAVNMIALTHAALIIARVEMAPGYVQTNTDVTASVPSFQTSLCIISVPSGGGGGGGGGGGKMTSMWKTIYVHIKSK